MKISTKSRYGLRAMADLAVHGNEGPVPLAVIAGRQDISPLYLEQVFSTLKKAGLVRSTKGPGGGYMLGVSPSELNLGTLLGLLEGGLAVVDEPGSTGAESPEARCLRARVWTPMNEAASRLAEETTLADLVSSYQKTQSPDAGIYFI